MLGDSYDLNTHSWNPDGIRVIRQQDFWFVFFMTILCVNSPLSSAAITECTRCLQHSHPMVHRARGDC